MAEEPRGKVIPFRRPERPQGRARALLGTATGIDRAGQPFAVYSPQYAKIRKVGGRPTDKEE